MEERLLLAGTPPYAADDSRNTDVDTFLMIDVLTNDTDVESDIDPMTLAVATQPGHGTAYVSPGLGMIQYMPPTDFEGYDTFTYTVQDSQGNLSNVATVTVTVGTPNQTPVADAAAFTTDEDAAIANQVTGYDADGTTPSFWVETPPMYGVLDLQSDGTFTYTPLADWSGVVTFTFTAYDGVDYSAPATVTITVNAVNDPPAVSDVPTFTIDEDTTLSQDLGPYASDVEGGSLTFIKISDPAGGTLVFNSDGTFQYTPDTNWAGSDSFLFQVYDGTDYSASQTVSITITPVNDAPVGSDTGVGLQEDDVDVAYAVGASDEDGDTLTYEMVTGPSNGTLNFAADGSFTYTPSANWNGTDAFTWRAYDGTAYSATHTFTFSVAAVNDAPVAYNAVFGAIPEDTVLTDSLASYAADVDGETPQFVVDSDPAHGTVVIYSDGTFDYAPNADWNGGDSFTFVAFDGVAYSAVATVTLTVSAVNDAPLADTPAPLSGPEDAPIAGSVTGSDVDGDTLQYATFYTPSHGTLALNPDGTFTYTPDADWSGADSFAFTAFDGLAYSVEATQVLTVGAVNDAPTVSALSPFAGNEDTSVSGDVSPFATDLEGDILTFQKASDPLYGTLTFNSDGTFVYTPGADWHGSDSFLFTVFDGTDYSAPATASVEIAPVNDVPVAPDASLDLDEDDVDAPGSAAFSDIDGDSLFFEQVAGPSHGSLSLFSSGLYTYTPDADWNGTDSFTYRASDGQAWSNTAQVTLNVAPKADAPTAADASFSVDEDTVLAGDLSPYGGDADGEPVQFLDSPALYGTVVLQTDGTFTYTPDANYHGQDSFTYSTFDGLLYSGTATVTVTVAPVNDAPLADTPAPFAGLEDVTVSGDLSGSDVEGDALTFEAQTLPAHGSLILGPNGDFSYFPDAGWSGSDAFTFRVFDGTAYSAPATADIVISPVNSAPIAQEQVVWMLKDRWIDIALSGSDSETPADQLTYELDSQPAHGTVTLSGGLARYTPEAGFAGTDSFSFVAVDGDEEASEPAGIVVRVPIVFEAGRPGQFANTGGDTVILAMAGPGYGLAYLDDDAGMFAQAGEGEGYSSGGFDLLRVQVTQTTAASSVFIYSPVFRTPTAVKEMLFTGPIYRLYAPGVDLAGDMTMWGGGAYLIQMNDVIGPSTIDIAGSSVTTSLYLRDVRDLCLHVQGKLGDVMARTWLNTDGSSDNLEAASLSRLLIYGDAARKVAGNFQANLSLGDYVYVVEGGSRILGPSEPTVGTSPLVSRLALASIDGSVSNSTWTIEGHASQIFVGASSDHWTANVWGNVNLAWLKDVIEGQLTVGGVLANLLAGTWSSGSIQAGRIDQLLLQGNFTSSTLSLSGSSSASWLLGLATVLGNLSNAEWNIFGGAGWVSVGSVSQSQITVEGGLYSFQAGQVSSSSLEVGGRLTRLMTGAWQGGSIQALAASLIHIGGNFEGGLNINPLGQSLSGRVLDIFAVCGAIANSTLRIGGNAGLVHGRSMFDSSLTIGSPAGGETSPGETSPSPFTLDLLVVGYPYASQSFASVSVSGYRIGGIYLAGPISVSSVTVRCHSLGVLWPGLNSGVDLQLV